MNEQPNAARRRRTHGAKWNALVTPRLMLGGGALLFVLISLFCWLLSGAADRLEEDDPVLQAAVSIAPSADPVVWDASSEQPESEPEPTPEASSESEPPSASSESASSAPEPASSSAASEPNAASSSLAAPAASEAVPSSSAASSSEPPTASSPASSSQPEQNVSEQPASSAQPEEDPVVIDLSALEQPEEPSEEEDPIASGSYSDPKSHPDAADETLLYTSGGAKKQMNAYDLICRAVQNETNGLLAPEALKAHAVATYTMIKYNNVRGLAPSVVLKTPVSSSTEKAVEAVLGQAVYYQGNYANTVYHSTSGGQTTSSQAVWGGALPYLVSVDSPYDKQAPGYKSMAVVSRKNFAKRVEQVYGIALDGDPADWIEAERDAPGGYVGTVSIGGDTRSQGGSYGTGTITGRSVREQLLSFGLRSHCFEVEYNDDKEQFEFTTYGYGHGVGMSQYGAHYMALDGYDYLEILEHYYTGTTVE